MLPYCVIWVMSFSKQPLFKQSCLINFEVFMKPTSCPSSLSFFKQNLIFIFLTIVISSFFQFFSIFFSLFVHFLNCLDSITIKCFSTKFTTKHQMLEVEEIFPFVLIIVNVRLGVSKKVLQHPNELLPHCLGWLIDSFI